jgi:hypothetical protein
VRLTTALVITLLALSLAPRAVTGGATIFGTGGDPLAAAGLTVVQATPSVAGESSTLWPPVPSSGGAVKVRAGSGGSPTLSAVVQDPEQGSDGGAVEGGLASYVSRSYGSRYLALPGGPGIRVTICAKRCVTRTSTDAGPSLQRQRAGRVADVSWSDFRWICRCSPEAVGLIVVSVQDRDVLPAPSTDGR